MKHADGNSAWKIDIITGYFFLKKKNSKIGKYITSTSSGQRIILSFSIKGTICVEHFIMYASCSNPKASNLDYAQAHNAHIIFHRSRVKLDDAIEPQS